jgi:hypothetical protein
MIFIAMNLRSDRDDMRLWREYKMCEKAEMTVCDYPGKT